MWVTFAVGTRWSALGVGVGLGEGRERRGRPSETRREREREMRRVQNGTERVNGVLFDCLATYMGISYILWASRRPCGTYKAGRWLCAPSDSELGTPSSELGVPLGNAEHGGRVAGDLRDTLNVDPNPNGIVPLQRDGGCAHRRTRNSELGTRSSSRWCGAWRTGCERPAGHFGYRSQPKRDCPVTPVWQITAWELPHQPLQRSQDKTK